MQPEPCHEDWIAALDAIAESELGFDPRKRSALAAAVEELSRVYTRERGDIGARSASDQAFAARLCFFLPRDLPKVQLPLCELHAAGVLTPKERLRILDLGAGLGTTTLGVAAFVGRAALAPRLEVDAVDADPRALRLARLASQTCAAHCGVEVALAPVEADLARPGRLPVGDGYDLVIAGSVLNELFPDRGLDARLAAQRAWLSAAARRLSPDGALIVVEPALREPSRALQRLRDVAGGDGPGPHLFAPCLHTGQCPLLSRERDWCHQSLDLPMAPTLAARARDASLGDHGLRFSYLTLTARPRSLAEVCSDGRALRVVSNPQRTKGKLELRLCGAGESRWLRRLDRHRSVENEALDGLRRGSLIRLSPEPSPASASVEVGDGVRVERLRR